MASIYLRYIPVDTYFAGEKEQLTKKQTTAPTTKMNLKKNRKIKLRKHSVVRGIRITDAESKKKVLELLAAEESIKDMDMMS